MSPANSTFTLSPATSRVILAGKDSVPEMVFAATALATACSISRWELMPTAFRNFRILKFRVSSFIEDLRFLSRAGSIHRGTDGQMPHWVLYRMYWRRL